MKKIVLYILLSTILFSCKATSVIEDPTENIYPVEPGIRNILKWPFAQNSIWNMPIGENAIYVPAKIEKVTKAGMTVDEDYLVLSPDSPLVDIYENFAGWSMTKSRCEAEGKLLFSAPIPKSFRVAKGLWKGDVPNSGLAVLMADKTTIRQTQPFAFCDPNKPATSQYMFPNQSIYGAGILGAHGGSGMSAIGGTLRCGELTPTSGAIRHAMKINLYCALNVYYDDETKGFRWPAVVADYNAKTLYGSVRSTKPEKALRMGALLALPAKMNLDSLGFETVPARVLAEAFQNYGAYLVDDTAWNVYAIETEWSPEGRFVDDFKKNWGFSFTDGLNNTPWTRDMERIYLNLHVVDNNSLTSIGGGGKPRMPLAPLYEKLK